MTNLSRNKFFLSQVVLASVYTGLVYFAYVFLPEMVFFSWYGLSIGAYFSSTHISLKMAQSELVGLAIFLLALIPLAFVVAIIALF